MVSIEGRFPGETFTHSHAYLWALYVHRSGRYEAVVLILRKSAHSRVRLFSDIILPSNLCACCAMFAENKSRYEKPEDLIWDTYLKAAKGEDEARPKNWEGSTTGILTFVRRAIRNTASMVLTRTVDWSFRCYCCSLHNREL